MSGRGAEQAKEEADELAKRARTITNQKRRPTHPIHPKSRMISSVVGVPNTPLCTSDPNVTLYCTFGAREARRAQLSRLAWRP